MLLAVFMCLSQAVALWFVSHGVLVRLLPAGLPRAAEYLAGMGLVFLSVITLQVLVLPNAPNQENETIFVFRAEPLEPADLREGVSIEFKRITPLLPL